MIQNRKENQTLGRFRVDGCVGSLVDQNGVEYFYGVATPAKGDAARAQIFSAFDVLDAAIQEAGDPAIVKLNVFLREIGDKQLVRAIMRSRYGDTLPTTTFIPQKATDERVSVVLEATAIGPSRDSDRAIPVRVDRRTERATIVDFADVSLGFFGGFVPSPEPIGAYARSFDAFAQMRAEVEANGFLFPQVFRTWLYQGHIVLEEGETQRYKELNRARSDFFYGTRFLEKYQPKDAPLRAIYPASTGIGADDVDIATGCQAIKTDRDDALVVPLENPNQTSAFDYSEFYSPQSPKFARACAVKFNERCSVYVSGTASIVDQKTVFIDDPEGQTNQTLDNIAALISGDNLAKHGVSGFDAALEDLAVARVYVKKPEQVEFVRNVCEKRLASVPVVCVYADVCRDDLLVEIEGIVSCKIA